MIENEYIRRIIAAVPVSNGHSSQMVVFTEGLIRIGACIIMFVLLGQEREV